MKMIKATVEFDDDSQLIFDFSDNTVLASYPISSDKDERDCREKELKLRVSKLLKVFYGL